MIAAGVPIQRASDARLLVVDEDGAVTHHARTELPDLVRTGDVVIANDAATLPASLAGVHVPTGASVELRLAAQESLLPERVGRFVAVVFGAGDFRTPTERRPQPPRLQSRDALQLGPLRAEVVKLLAHPRLIEIQFVNSTAEIWAGIARHGRPIQYAYIPQPLAIWDSWTAIAGQPVAFEPPSAGFILDWTMIGQLRARGATFATLTHAAGLSSTGDPDLDRRLPFDEPYDIPPRTAALIEPGRRRGRVIAIGTTVVRALEHAARADRTVRPGSGIATQRVDPLTQLQVVDAVVTGVHERGTSHHELLRAFQDDAALSRMEAEAEARGYRAHEFGDSVLIARDRRRSAHPALISSAFASKGKLECPRPDNLKCSHVPSYPFYVPLEFAAELPAQELLLAQDLAVKEPVTCDEIGQQQPARVDQELPSRIRANPT